MNNVAISVKTAPNPQSSNPSQSPKTSSPPAYSPVINKRPNLTGDNLQRKAEEMGALYLPDDTSERRENLVRVFIASQQLTNPPTDVEILSAFFLYDGDADKAAAHLRSFSQLEELGFTNENITQALYLNGAKFDEALDHLMKNS
jgi:hypothetical protein